MADSDNPIRKWRSDNDLSLEEACQKFAESGLELSTAKLSRIERDQPVPHDMLPKLQHVTGLSARVLRPDLAKIFDEGAA